MISIVDLIRRSFLLYSQNFFTVFKVIVWLLIFNLISIFLSPFGQSGSLVNVLVSSCILALSFLLGAWTDQLLTAVLYGFYKKQPVEFHQKAKDSFKYLPGYVLVLILCGLIITVGFIFLIIPGFIFMTWYLFISPIFVVEGLRGWRVFRRSRELVRGLGLQIFARFFFPFLFFILIFWGIFRLASLSLASLPNVENLEIILSIISVVFARFLSSFLSSVIVILYDEVRGPV